MTPFGKEISDFLRAAHDNNLRVLLVGGGAVNFHGYQRHSADIDFWIEPSTENFDRLLNVLRVLGYELSNLPEAVLRQEQNISIKISPEMEIELITRFTSGRTFEEAWGNSEVSELAGEPVALFRVLSYEDLIASKLRSARPKDLLDVQELRRKKGK
ncbi:MAG: nucleotidyl transferase AbiEii/AbiGii toxin family protein [Flavobacteriales bacterium]